MSVPVYACFSHIFFRLSFVILFPVHCSFFECEFSPPTNSIRNSTQDTLQNITHSRYSLCYKSSPRFPKLPGFLKSFQPPESNLFRMSFLLSFFYHFVSYTFAFFAFLSFSLSRSLPCFTQFSLVAFHALLPLTTLPVRTSVEANPFFFYPAPSPSHHLLFRMFLSACLSFYFYLSMFHSLCSPLFLSLARASFKFWNLVTMPIVMLRM